MATYAIGDLQGCYDELRALLTHINFSRDRDRLWFCGDLVNRGPKSLETLRFIRSLEDNALTVLGNHDLHLLAVAFIQKKHGNKDTLHGLLQADDATDLLNWLRQQHLAYHDPERDITLLHAGTHPGWSIKKTLKLAAEVEQVLRSDQHIEFYSHMYGNKPANWDDSLTGWSRYRFITNILTRMRYCDMNGKPAFSEKGPPGTQAKGLLPWYEVPSRKTRKNTIIFGHWSTLPDSDSGINNCYSIDSGCVWGGKLTALRIDVNPFEYIRLACPGAQKPMLKTKKEHQN